MTTVTKKPSAGLLNLIDRPSGRNRGRGLTGPSSDALSHLSLAPDVRPWVKGVWAIDTNRDIGPYLRLLDLGVPPPRGAIPFLVDLFTRKLGPRSKNNPRKPLWKTNYAEATEVLVREYIARGLNLSDALDRSAEEMGRTRDSVEEFHRAKSYKIFKPKKKKRVRRRPAVKE